MPHDYRQRVIWLGLMINEKLLSYIANVALRCGFGGVGYMSLDASGGTV